MSDIKICSLNVRGIRNKVKRTALFNYFKQMKYDIICLQETHGTKEDFKIWEKHWGAECIFQEGTNRSKGEAILVSKHFIGEVHKIECSERIIIVSIKIDNALYYLVNVYAPNANNEKILFFELLEDKLHEISNSLIIVGDLNCVINNELDIISGQPHSQKEVGALNKCVNTLGLADVWRAMHSEDKDFTWSRSHPFIARRLDYCFVSKHSLNLCHSCELYSVPNTDHKAVVINFKEDNFKRGPGFWKFNNSLLKDHAFVKGMNNLLDDLHNENENNKGSMQLAWEICKVEIRNYCIEFGKTKSCHMKNRLLSLQNELKEIETNLINDSDNEILQQRFLQTKQKLDILQIEKARGAQVRARQKWIEEGEKNTAFFCSLEKSKRTKNTMTKLRKQSGELITDQHKILEEQVNFYENLYNQETEASNIERDTEMFLENIIKPTLSDNNANLCEGQINLEEMSMALSKLKNGSAPGCDGLTTEFYKFFWMKIGPILVESYKEAFEKGELSMSQRQGIITLLHKGKDLEKEILDNWRPITLLNTDYKILAKTLAIRMSRVVHDLINEDQVGYLKGRSITSVIRTIDDVINYVKETKTAGFLLALDFSKAFDSISKDLISYSFNIFGFKQDFQRWIQVIMKNCESSVLYGGWISNSFKVNCGIRQGCPLSPLAFILAVELLALKIRNSTIKGIENPKIVNNTNYQTKIKQMADDTTLFLEGKQDIIDALEIMSDFGKISGLKINLNKTKALQMGNKKDENLPIEVVSKIKILGIYFERDKMAKEIADNYNGKIQKIEMLCRNWSQRDLSIHGKIVVIKTFLLSQLIYQMQSIGIPADVLRNINVKLYKFLWQRKFNNRKAFEKVKRKIMESDYENGGVKMVNLIELQECFYIQWMAKLLHSNEKDWNAIPFWHFKGLARDKEIFKINCLSKQMKGMETIKNGFWKEALKAYLDNKTLVSETEINESNVHSLHLFNNTLLKYKGKMLFFGKWVKSNITCLKDLIKITEKRFLNLQEVQLLINQNPATTMFEYFAICNALPKLWKDWVFSGRISLKNKKREEEQNDISTNLREIKTFIRIKKSETTKACGPEFWKHKLNIELDETFWIIPRMVSKEVRLRELQWKINHNIYPTNILLHKMKVVESVYCSYCANEIDFLEHFFYYCETIKCIWNHVENLIVAKTGKRVKITVKHALFGIPYNGDNEYTYSIANHLILIAKMCISSVKKRGSKIPIWLAFEEALRIRSID